MPVQTAVFLGIHMGAFSVRARISDDRMEVILQLIHRVSMCP